MNCDRKKFHKQSALDKIFDLASKRQYAVHYLQRNPAEISK